MAWQRTYTTTGRINFGDVDPGAIGSYVFQVGGTFSSLVAEVQARVKPSPGDAEPAWVDKAYENFGSGTAVAQGTNLTASGIYKVTADGCDISLDVSTLSGGTLVITAVPLVG